METWTQPEYTAQVVDLGPNNAGQFGPGVRSDEEQQASSEVLARPEYSKRPTNRWICVDGRTSADEVTGLSEETDEADPQLGGGVVVSETAADFMIPGQTKPESQLLAEKTTEAVDNGQRVTVHGDDHKGKGGCAANVKKRDILRYNAANMDVVAPLAWAVSQGLNISQHIQPEDVTEAIIAGKESADNDALFDVTPDQAVDIIVANGGEYIELLGEHMEGDVRVSLVDDAFDKVRYASDRQDLTPTPQAFSASLGHYKEYVFELAQKQGHSDREAALRVLRVVLYNVGLPKSIINKNMRATLLTSVQS